MGLSDDNELVEFTDSQTSALSHQECGRGWGVKGDTDCYYRPPPISSSLPIKNPPFVKKQEAIYSDPLCPRKKAHVIPLESCMIWVLSIVRFFMSLVAKVFGVHLAFRLLFTLHPLFLDLWSFQKEKSHSLILNLSVYCRICWGLGQKIGWTDTLG